MNLPGVRDTDWSQIYRPQSLEDCILPARIKAPLETMISSRAIHNLIFHGRSGVGKTSTAKAIFNDTDADVLELNGSLDTSIVYLRENIEPFTSTCSLWGRRKVVFIDEAEGLSRESQAALRAFIESVSKSCSFVFTTNHIEKLSPAIQSRCICVDFTFTSEEAATMKMDFASRISSIISKEEVTVDRVRVATLISTLFPEFRQILKQVQFISE